MTKLTPAQEKFIATLEVGTENEDVTNPFSGVTCNLTPVGVALYDFIMGAQMLGKYKDFDRARYIFAELFPDEYMKLID